MINSKIDPVDKKNMIPNLTMYGKMLQSENRKRISKGFSFIEVIIASVILILIITGALTYQYYAALHVRASMAQMTATRTAHLLLDDWKSAGGSSVYDPTSLNLGFTDSSLNALEGAEYQIHVDNLPMYLNLSYCNIEQDTETLITLRKITVLVKWRNDYNILTGQAEDASSMTLSTYVRMDASSG